MCLQCLLLSSTGKYSTSIWGSSFFFPPLGNWNCVLLHRLVTVHLLSTVTYFQYFSSLLSLHSSFRCYCLEMSHQAANLMSNHMKHFKKSSHPGLFSATSVTDYIIMFYSFIEHLYEPLLREHSANELFFYTSLSVNHRAGPWMCLGKACRRCKSPCKSYAKRVLTTVKARAARQNVKLYLLSLQSVSERLMIHILSY